MEWNQTGLGVETVGGCRHCEEDGDRQQTEGQMYIHQDKQTDRHRGGRVVVGVGGVYLVVESHFLVL